MDFINTFKKFTTKYIENSAGEKVELCCDVNVIDKKIEQDNKKLEKILERINTRRILEGLPTVDDMNAVIIGDLLYAEHTLPITENEIRELNGEDPESIFDEIDMY